MKHIVLINPNTSAKTTALMTDIARRYVPKDYSITALTAESGVPMIINVAQLKASENEVIKMGLSQASTAQGIIISAFGDPGLETLRARISIPVVGLCEASMIEAARNGRKFGIATVTPDLVECFSEKARGMGFDVNYTGTRLTEGDPVRLAADQAALLLALERAAQKCIDDDGAEVVIIGGGPLGLAAESLQNGFAIPIISPIRCAVELLTTRIDLALNDRLRT
ncbi:aspartate/glutamate racemase family protein [Agrobacterium rubi]|uniref:Hydantoin racemase n=1 Tax=Agrobacterium rubi TR3 = NBRC 13261 TaxID=1368415 RepID=A0A081CZ55_9HYPH|nr:aspartate/glutamate racemase family protein [Agrobacterium rubi]MBP1880266.1 Asp/Glu/hydantoin racemase [Agrobacterium rubi]MCL6654724.1 hydantoin racemase [Agrobacterium rubi]NTF09114.1 aspartate/glutamate racemase family protein [Agrobacterium rubi]NTF21384.1 aspartate/glutamate racemase family protein [Agrobacterium rubi]NTF28241.1 aspartate/glutamate racemase family protein [Agrobacterium rubi]